MLFRSVFAMAQVEGGDKPLSNMKAGQEVRIERGANGVINALSVTTVDNSQALFRRQEAMSRNLRMDAGVLSFNDLTIDPIAREVHLHQQPVELTPREFDLLYFFARHPGQVFSRLSLLNQVWGYQHEGYEHTVNTHINRLRIKIERNPAEPERILTVWGMGYKFAAAPQE